MLNATDVMKDLESQIKENGEEPQEIVQEIIPQESLVNEKKEPEEDELPEEAPQGNLAWKNMRQAQKKTRDKLKEEREAREKTQEELQQLKERLARMEGREEVRVKPVEEKIENPEPDRMLDPDAWRDWRIAKQDEEIAAVKIQSANAAKISEIEGTRRGMARLENDYKKSTGLIDYDDRINFILNAEKAKQKILNPGATDSQIDNYLEAEKFRLANDALANKQNPAELFYKMADVYGYQAKKTESKSKPDIEAINKNMEKTVNLIGSSSVDKTGGLTPQQAFQGTLQELVGKQPDIEKLIKKYSQE